jgi:hypothetical protein
MPSPADRAQALRAVGIVVLSMGAAALAAGLVFALAAHHWRPALTLGLFTVSLAGGVHALFRGYLNHSPRHKGGH